MPASARAALENPMRFSPPLRASRSVTVVPFRVTVTGKVFGPAPSDATCSSERTIAAAGPRGSSVVVMRSFDPTVGAYRHDIGPDRRVLRWAAGAVDRAGGRCAVQPATLQRAIATTTAIASALGLTVED